MNANAIDGAASCIAAAIGEPTRARMLYCLMDGRARTSSELAAVAEVTPSTASVHLQRLKSQRLVRLHAQGKHRYYSLGGPDVAAVLESLGVLAGGSHARFMPGTPPRLRGARTCYDHIAGTLGVMLHDAFESRAWLSPSAAGEPAYDLTPEGIRSFEALGIDIEAARSQRRRFAFACLDWSERRSHLGGALAAAFLQMALDREWVIRDRGSRALVITRAGQRSMRARLGFSVHENDAGV
jgi:DNA-binding transcriptional ArsR family regulator